MFYLQLEYSQNKAEISFIYTPKSKTVHIYSCTVQIALHWLYYLFVYVADLFLLPKENVLSNTIYECNVSVNMFMSW